MRSKRGCSSFTGIRPERGGMRVGQVYCCRSTQEHEERCRTRPVASNILKESMRTEIPHQTLVLMRHTAATIFAAWSLLAVLPAVAAEVVGSPLRPTDLRCEYLIDPLGIDVTQPRLSWRLEVARARSAADGVPRDRRVPPGLAEPGPRGSLGLGKVDSDQSIQLEYGGRELKSEMRLPLEGAGVGQRWQAVAVEQARDLVDGALEAGRLDGPVDRAGRRCGGEAGRRAPPPSRPDVRREFLLATKWPATAYVCGLGFFELYLNGRKIGDHIMDPALTSYDKRAMYVTFDVTSTAAWQECRGRMLGNGRFFAPRIRVPIADADLRLSQAALSVACRVRRRNAKTRQ